MDPGVGASQVTLNFPFCKHYASNLLKNGYATCADQEPRMGGEGDQALASKGSPPHGGELRNPMRPPHPHSTATCVYASLRRDARRLRKRPHIHFTRNTSGEWRENTTSTAALTPSKAGSTNRA